MFFVFVTVLLVGAGAEILGSLGYRFLLPATEREAIEAALGFDRGSWNTVLRYRPHPYLNYVSNVDYGFADGTRPHHAIGIRDPKFDPTAPRTGGFRIVSLGGSTTYGLFVERTDQVWPELVGLGLSQTLGTEVEVVNAAVPNYTTNEIIGMSAFWVPEFQPDLVLLHTGLNDAFTVAFPDEGGPDGTRFRYSWSYRGVPTFWSDLMRKSRLARLVGARALRGGGYLPGDMTASMQYPPPPEQERKQHIQDATGKYFRRNLETIAALIRRSGAEPVFVEMALNPQFESGMDYYRDAISAAVMRNNEILRETGGRLGVQVVPVYDQMRDPDMFIDAAHVTQKGMLRKAQLVYDAVLPTVKQMLAE
jgi:lysophospholipase L1-like esterase